MPSPIRITSVTFTLFMSNPMDKTQNITDPLLKKYMERMEDLKADIAILEKKHEFLMELLTEKQLQEYEDFCEEHGF